MGVEHPETPQALRRLAGGFLGALLVTALLGALLRALVVAVLGAFLGRAFLLLRGHFTLLWAFDYPLIRRIRWDCYFRWCLRVNFTFLHQEGGIRDRVFHWIQNDLV